MDNEVLRQTLMVRIDSLLARPLLVWGQDRTLLSAVRGFVAGMTTDELTRMNAFMVKASEDTAQDNVW